MTHLLLLPSVAGEGRELRREKGRGKWRFYLPSPSFPFSFPLFRLGSAEKGWLNCRSYLGAGSTEAAKEGKEKSSLDPAYICGGILHDDINNLSWFSPIIMQRSM